MNIGTLERFTDLREIWPTEPNLSDWLVSDEGLARLADDLGIEIEDPIRESRPGDYPCDIVGRAVGQDNHIIIIENQFGRTNHDHLGKLLTYAAMHSAMTCIWICEIAFDDHRKVIDWLNDNTPPNISLFLVELEAYHIGNSPVAPKLKVKCSPNVQAKQQTTEIPTTEKERRDWRRNMWGDILTFIQSNQPPFRVQSPSGDAWSRISIGRAHFWIEFTLTPRRGCIGCELAFDVSWKDIAIQQLETDRLIIEGQIGDTLQWLKMEGRNKARILLEASINPKDENNREAAKQWMYEKSLAFYNAFHDRVLRLQPPANILESADIDLEAPDTEK